jgi:hypothetical protein
LIVGVADDPDAARYFVERRRHALQRFEVRRIDGGAA